MFGCNKVTHFCLKCPAMDPWLNWSFQNMTKSEFRLSWLYLVYQYVVFHLDLDCHKQISIFQDILGSNKVTHFCLKCSTMDPCLKLKFPKLHEIRIWTFLYVFRASKCRLSPRVVIVITKLVYFEISFIVRKGLILVSSVQLWTHG